MPGRYAPFKVYVPFEILTAADLNATDQNHIINQTPQMTDDYSINSAQQQEQLDPALGLAISLAEELKQLRFVISKMGGASWNQVTGPNYEGLAGHVSGFYCANDITFPNAINVFPGAATGIVLGTPMRKHIDNPWSPGHEGGGLDTGSIALVTGWYMLYVIKNMATGAVDVIASHDYSPALPAGYTKFERIFAVFVDTDGFIKTFKYTRDWILWQEPALDVNVADLGTLRTFYNVTAPPLGTIVLLNIMVANFTDQALVYVSSPDLLDMAPTLSTTPLATIKVPIPGAPQVQQIIAQTVQGGTSSQIAARSSHPNTDLRVATLAFRNIV